MRLEFKERFHMNSALVLIDLYGALVSGKSVDVVGAVNLDPFKRYCQRKGIEICYDLRHDEGVYRVWRSK